MRGQLSEESSRAGSLSPGLPGSAAEAVSNATLHVAESLLGGRRGQVMGFWAYIPHGMWKEGGDTPRRGGSFLEAGISVLSQRTSRRDPKGTVRD